jgi:hypothetical protein
MSTSLPASKYVLLIRNIGWHEHHSPEEILQLMNRFNSWVERLSTEGRLKGGQSLTYDSKIIGPKKMVTDGPYAESKEAIAGFIVIQSGSLEEAAEIAKGAPCLDYGQIIELRVIASEAQELQIARQRLGNQLFPTSQALPIKSGS